MGGWVGGVLDGWMNGWVLVLVDARAGGWVGEWVGGLEGEVREGGERGTCKRAARVYFGSMVPPGFEGIHQARIPYLENYS